MDLEISQILCDRSSMIGKLVNYLAYLPSFLLVFCCAGSVWWYNRSRKAEYAAAVLPVLAGISCGAVVKDLTGWSVSSAVIIALAVTAAIFAAFMICKPEITARQNYACCLFLIAALGSFTSVTVIKHIWGRMRFYAMSDPASQFTPWYIIRPFSQGFDTASFPSGHTSFAVLVLFLIMVPKLKEKDFSDSVIFTGCVIWLMIVMYGRIVYGVHFLSDTAFGLLNGLLWNGITQAVTLKKIDKI